ncbi:MAG: hypothetical protein ACI4SF_05035 [Oscillospiraceae bacterium]
MSDYKKPLSDYGKKVKIALMERNRKQEWLISEVKKRYPDIYIDSSNLYKILIGEITGGKVVSAISEILSISA